MKSRRSAPFLAVRRELERAVGTPLTDKQWDALCNIGDVGVVAQGGGSIEPLVEQFRMIEAAFSGAGQSDTHRPLQPRQRRFRPLAALATHRSLELSYQEALSAVVAELAREDPEVIAFRREVLDGRLLIDMPSLEQRDSVTDWLEREIAREQPLLAAGGAAAVWFTYSEVFEEGPIQARVAPGGILDRLRTLGETLAAHYRWSPAAAIAFVLTDEEPTIDAVTAKIEGDVTLPALSRISLSIDPVMPPAAVARAYQQARSHLARRRIREMPPKSLALAAFAAWRPPREPLKQQIWLWNAWVAEVHPEWRYDPARNTQRANFARDRKQASKRLLAPMEGLVWGKDTLAFDVHGDLRE